MERPEDNPLSEDLAAFLDGELPAAPSERIRRAIDADPLVAAEVEELAATWGLLAAVPGPQAPAVDLADRVMDRVRPMAEANRRRLLVIRRTMVGALAAAAVLLLAALVGVLRQGQPSDTAGGRGEWVQVETGGDDLAGRSIPPEVEDVLISSLDVVMNQEVLENFETLRALDAEGLLGDAALQELEAPGRVRQMLGNTSQKRLVQLLKRQEAFRRLAPQVQQRYRRGARQVYDLVASLPADRQAHLNAMSEEARTQALVRIIEEKQLKGEWPLKPAEPNG